MANLMNNVKGSKKLFLAAVAVIGTYGMAPTADAALLVDFKPDPTSAGHPEMVFNGTSLTAGNGATGNNDPTTAGGLRIGTPYVIPTTGIGGTVNNGTTSFEDVSLVLSGLNASGPASITTIAPGVILLAQTLDGSGGSFALRSSGAAPEDLLVGRITRAFLTGIQGSPTGSVISAEVEYTDGLVYDQLIANGLPTTGSVSWSLLDIGTSLGGLDGLQLDLTTGSIAPFQANAVGIFSNVIPEPGTVAMLGIGGLLLAARRRK